MSCSWLLGLQPWVALSSSELVLPAEVITWGRID